MSNRFVIALSWPASKAELSKISRWLSPKWEVACPKTYGVDDFVAVAENADAILGSFIPQAVIDRAKKVRMIQVLHTGIAATKPGEPDLGFSLESLKKRGILLGNADGANSVAIAEHAFALILAMAKRILRSHQAVANGDPYPRTSENFNVQLTGKTIGIIGLGHIGIELCNRAKAFGMRVIGIKRTPERQTAGHADVAFVGSPADLHRVLKESDFVVLTAPLTAETEGMIGERELRSMKPAAYLINVARAMLVEEKALKRALAENWIAGFASDVWYPPLTGRKQSEGMSSHFALPSWEGIHKLPNVVATGNRASYTPETIENVLRVSVENVNMLAKGMTPTHLVDLERGY